MARPAASWSEIPSELLLLIVTSLQCFADRVSVAAVCHAWRAIVQHLAAPPPRRQLPWLLLPSDDAPFFASFLSGARRRIFLPEDVRAARLCGSHEGGWLAVASGHHGPYALANVFSRTRAWVPLPDGLQHLPFEGPLPVVICGVTLSAAPTSPGCLAAAHVWGAPNIAFCRPGVDEHWVAPFVDVDGLQDILYYKGEPYEGFYVINNENLFLFGPRDLHGAQLMMRQMIFSIQPRVGNQLPNRLGLTTSTVVSRYLVESRGKLLMVVRYSRPAGASREQRTVQFKVFEMATTALPHGGHAASWVELNGLDARVLFIGRGCSRAFEAGQCRGFQEGSIYFLDDASEISFLFNDQSKFPAVDMGTYSAHEIVRPGLPLNPSAFDNQGQGSSLYGERTLVGHIKRITVDNSNNQVALERGGNSNPTERAAEANTFNGNTQFVRERANVWHFPCECRSSSSRPSWFLP